MTKTLWIGGALLCLASLVLYGFGSNNPAPMRWAALSMLVSVSLILWAWRPIFRLYEIDAIALLFVAYAATSIMWSPDWREGLLSLYQLVLLAGLFLTVRHADRRMISATVPIVASAAVLCTVYADVVTPGAFGGMGNENFQAEFLLLLIPACMLGLVAWEGRFAGGLCVSAAGLALFMLFYVNQSHAKWAGLAGLGALLVIVMIRHRFIRAAVLCLAVGCAVAWFVAGSAWQSVTQRVELAYNTLLMWLDRPIFGTGLGGFNYIYPWFQEAHADLIPGRSLYGIWLFAGATHNEYVQALAVFGIFGVIILCWLAWCMVRDRHNDTLSVYALTVLFIFAGLAAVNFPMQNPSTAIIGVVALGTVARPGRVVEYAALARFARRAFAYWIGRPIVGTVHHFGAAPRASDGVERCR